MKRIGIYVLCFVIALIGALFFNRNTFHYYQDQVSLRQESEARMQQAEKVREERLEERAYLESEVGKEERARGMGYKKPGEVLIR